MNGIYAMKDNAIVHLQPNILQIWKIVTKNMSEKEHKKRENEKKTILG